MESFQGAVLDLNPTPNRWLRFIYVASGEELGQVSGLAGWRLITGLRFRSSDYDRFRFASCRMEAVFKIASLQSN